MQPIERLPPRIPVLSLLILLAALAGCGSGSPPARTVAAQARAAGIPWALPPRPIPGLRQETVGAGPGAAVILSAEGSPPPRRTVVFFHGWQALPPFAERAWITHLARRGASVVYPVYQGRATEPRRFLAEALAGVSLALRRLHPDPGELVAIGRSVGGALAFDFAAAAPDAGLPAPRAVLAVYPGRRPPGGVLPSARLSRIVPDTLLEVIAGPGDPLPGAGREARGLLAGATAVPPRRRWLLRPAFPRDVPHTPAAVVRAAERRDFWRPADELIERVRAG
jgi:acetyl esterase/lipase